MSADPPQPLDPDFRIELPGYEGPLDLLLHLIRQHELDILDLPISFITERYLAYLSLMKRLNLDVASEYLVMAATLAHIKSRSLLPQAPPEEEESAEDEMDPREELIRRLLAYQKYRHAAEDLGALGVAGRDVFPRGIPAPQAEGPGQLAEISIFKLIDAFSRVLERGKQDLALEVTRERITIQARMTEIIERLRERGRCRFEELFDDIETTYDIVVTFLAMLEMGKMCVGRLYQADPSSPIYIEYRVGAELAGETAAEAGPGGEDDQTIDSETGHSEPSLDSANASAHEQEPAPGQPRDEE
ncbi:MAG: segregation/condensation protein A [Deltaproteobacteria bacterium]|nr:segregation/condensation protein A [Deltaproteobacteria bacterium]